jgi:hypothetical protein
MAGCMRLAKICAGQVQQDAARGLGVSPNSLSLPLKSGGSRELKREDYKSLLWDTFLDSRFLKEQRDDLPYGH